VDHDHRTGILTGGGVHEAGEEVLAGQFEAGIRLGVRSAGPAAIW
jgi:hypothetical protein